MYLYKMCAIYNYQGFAKNLGSVNALVEFRGGGGGVL